MMMMSTIERLFIRKSPLVTENPRKKLTSIQYTITIYIQHDDDGFMPPQGTLYILMIKKLTKNVKVYTFRFNGIRKKMF